MDQHTISSMMKDKKYLKFSFDSPSYMNLKVSVSFIVSLYLNKVCSWDAKNNIRMNFVHRGRIVCVLGVLAEVIRRCKVDHTISERNRNCYRLARKKIEQKILNGSEI